jgi:hypothetical protein
MDYGDMSLMRNVGIARKSNFLVWILIPYQFWFFPRPLERLKLTFNTLLKLSGLGKVFPWSGSEIGYCGEKSRASYWLLLDISQKFDRVIGKERTS